MTEPVWLTQMQVMMLHAEALRLFGGAPGVRDIGLVQSALARPRNRLAYEAHATVFDLAASYGFGIVKGHAFVDGNKRVALLAVRAFLFRNGCRFDPPEAEAVSMMEALAAGRMIESAFAEWIAANTTC